MQYAEYAMNTFKLKVCNVLKQPQFCLPTAIQLTASVCPPPAFAPRNQATSREQEMSAAIKCCHSPHRGVLFSMFINTKERKENPS